MQKRAASAALFFCSNELSFRLAAPHPLQWVFILGRSRLLRTKIVVYCSVDPFLSSHGKFLHGFDSFQAELDQLEIPCVWLSSRSRLQLDEPRRRAGHAEPFVAEDGCGVYLPEDYFHLRPAKTVRLGRFTCIPIAKQQPEAVEALESLSQEAAVSVVPLRSLSPRELAQNIGLPTQEAELARQRDFDELFFFAGASDPDIAHCKSLAQQRGLSLREQGAIWSIAAGADLCQCIRELGELYDRSLRSHMSRFAIVAPGDSVSIFSACDRGVRLAANSKRLVETTSQHPRFLELAITARDLWDIVVSALTSRS